MAQNIKGSASSRLIAPAHKHGLFCATRLFRATYGLRNCAQTGARPSLIAGTIHQELLAKFLYFAPLRQPHFLQAIIVNDKVLFTLSFTAPDFGRVSGMFPYKIRAHPPEAYSERQVFNVVHYNIYSSLPEPPKPLPHTARPLRRWQGPSK